MSRIVLLLVLLLSTLAAHAVQVTDDRGVTVVLDHPPQRIVSLLPSLSETVCGLDQCERLVGVDRYSNYPGSLRLLPQLGGGMDPNIEAIVALKPDVVLLSIVSRGSAQLESLGLKVVALKVETFADAQRMMETLGTLMDVADAPRLWQETQAGIDAAARTLPPQVRRLRVFFEIGRGPYAAGESSFIGEMLARLGVQNIAPASLGPFPSLNPEFIVKADPDLIIVSDAGRADMAQRPGWSSLRAVREQRICSLSPEQNDIVSRPGPRMAEAAGILANCIAGKGLSR
jgi:iron complex transport system substrate-binding protein